MADGAVDGFIHDRFAPVRAAFETNLANGSDVGASYCATVEGEVVVDLWGGFADEARTRPWARDTIINVYSTTKTMTALTALLVADRGELDFDAPVARYWPEFAANGKQDIKVSHLMSHAVGQRQAGHQGQPPDEPCRRPVGLERADYQGRPLRLGQGHQPAGRPGAVLGAGLGQRLPRHHPGLSGGRGGPADHRQVAGHGVP